MIFPEGIPVFGDKEFRGKCPLEQDEQATFFNQLRKLYPDTLGLIAIHPRNEQLLIKGQFRAIKRHKSEGMVTGAADIIIPGCPAFVCELKRQDHTKSSISDDQIKYLLAAQRCGAFSCIALGHEAALQAVAQWLDWQGKD